MEANLQCNTGPIILAIVFFLAASGLYWFLAVTLLAFDEKPEEGLILLIIVQLIINALIGIWPIIVLNDCKGLDLSWWEWIAALLAVSMLNTLLTLYGYLLKRKSYLEIDEYGLWLVISTAICFFPLYTLLRFIQFDISWPKLLLLIAALTVIFNGLLYAIHGVLSINKRIKRAATYLLIAGISLAIGVPMVSFSLNSDIGFTFNKEAELKRKLKDLNKLQQRLDKKRKQIADSNTAYIQELNVLAEEVKSDIAKDDIGSLEEAKNHPRIKYNLNLIQRKMAYIATLERLTIRLNNGSNELQFLQRQATDDLRIYKTLKSEDVEVLIESIDQVIEEYLPEAAELPIDIDDSLLMEEDQIWEKIVRQK